MNTPRVLDAQGREITIGSRVTSKRRQTAATVRDSWDWNTGITVDHDGDHTWSFYRWERVPGQANTYRCPDLLVQKGPTE